MTQYEHHSGAQEFGPHRARHERSEGAAGRPFVLDIAPRRRLSPAAPFRCACIRRTAFVAAIMAETYLEVEHRLEPARILGRADYDRRAVRNASHARDRSGPESKVESGRPSRPPRRSTPANGSTKVSCSPSKYGYTKEVLKKVADREGHSHLGPLDLPAKYKADAEEVAERRAIEAGYRAAKSDRADAAVARS